jgi:Ca2+-binding RTX toxin-like protein
MNISALRRVGQFGLLATVGLAVPLVTVGPAQASSSASASIVGQTLNIVGSDAPDNIAVSVAAANPNSLLVDLGDGTTVQQFDRSAFDAINVSLGNGNDHFSASGVSMAQVSTIDGGKGDDTIVGTTGADVINGGNGNDNLNGGVGDDSITGGNGNDFVVGGLGHDTAALDNGDDTFRWDPGEGSDDVNGGNGNDALLFNGAGADETMSLSAVGSRAVFLRNPGNVTMNLDAVEQLDLHTLGGADSLTVNDLTGTSMRLANVDLSLSGDGGASDGRADLVTVNATNDDDHLNVVGQGTQVNVAGLQTRIHISGSNAAEPDRLQVNALDGNDIVTVDPSALAIIGVTTDLGAG